MRNIVDYYILILYTDMNLISFAKKQYIDEIEIFKILLILFMFMRYIIY